MASEKTLPLLEIIKQEIRDKGPMSIERYMELCLYDETHGYYITKDPIGKNGDFITAPEISPIFGETLGIFISHILSNNP